MVDYTDAAGRTYRIAPIDGIDDLALYPVIGPPPGLVDALGLAEPVATRLHNELHRRALWRLRDAQRRPQDVQAALMAAIRNDLQSIVGQYATLEGLQGDDK
jgi:hypothetical protein